MGSAICGVRVRMDYYRGASAIASYDDTSLNGAEFRCCPLPDLVNSTLTDCSTDHTTDISTLETQRDVSTVDSISETYGIKFIRKRYAIKYNICYTLNFLRFIKFYAINAFTVANLIFSVTHWVTATMSSEQWLVMGIAALAFVMIVIIFIYIFKRKKHIKSKRDTVIINRLNILKYTIFL